MIQKHFQDLWMLHLFFNHLTSAFCCWPKAILNNRSVRPKAVPRSRSDSKTGSPWPCVQNMSLTKRLSKGVNYPKTRSAGRRPSNKAGQMVLKHVVDGATHKGGRLSKKQVSRPKAVKQSRSVGSKGAPVHEAASTRRVCLTPLFTAPR